MSPDFEKEMTTSEVIVHVVEMGQVMIVLLFYNPGNYWFAWGEVSQFEKPAKTSLY
jgi:hypothetical protein